jgi:dTDP-glucose 4,6-dehydratase
MNVLVTGGAGFIGSNLVHYLLEEASDDLGMTINKVVNFDALTYAGNPNNLDSLYNDPRHLLVQGDLCDDDLVRNTLAEHDIDAIMHLAAESHVDRSIENPGQFMRTNVIGSFTLLHAFLNHCQGTGRLGGNSNVPCGRFLHVSTDEVFGSLSPEDPKFCETTPYAPNSPYSASKAGSDHIARAYFHTYGLPVITTNCSNNYGPRQFPEKLIPLMIQKVLRGQPLPVYGDGTNIRDWLYVHDHCRGLAMALVRGTPGETYCMGGNCELRNIDVVRNLIATVQTLAPNCAGARMEPESLISYVTDRPGHDHRYAIDSSKMQTELGWVPQETFESGLAHTVRWYLENQDWIAAIENKSYQGERLGLTQISC